MYSNRLRNDTIIFLILNANEGGWKTLIPFRCEHGDRLDSSNNITILIILQLGGEQNNKNPFLPLYLAVQNFLSARGIGGK